MNRKPSESGGEQLFDLDKDLREEHDLANDNGQHLRLGEWRARLVKGLHGRQEGFTDGTKLIPGRPYPPPMKWTISIRSPSARAALA